MRIKGTSVSSGKASGKIKVIKDESDRDKLESGDIILTSMGKMDANMLAKAGGVISPTGGLTSHLAKKCREMNIPCLVGIENHESLKDEDEVEVDADSGELRKI